MKSMRFEVFGMLNSMAMPVSAGISGSSTIASMKRSEFFQELISDSLTVLPALAFKASRTFSSIRFEKTSSRKVLLFSR
jgi:nitric oxide reductase large subunit